MTRQTMYISQLVLILGMLFPVLVFAQTTAFTYQGKLADNGTPANANFDLQFKLFDTVTVGTGTQQGNNVTISNVTVTAGIFTVQLDFGTCTSCLNGAARFLEIAVKPTSGGVFTTLGPRQQITSTPYAVKSLNAATADNLSLTCVSCVTSSQIQSVSGSLVTGTIPVASVPAGSPSYIQNTTSPQSTSNFNISGNGTIGGTVNSNVVNATTQYNIAGLRVFSVAGTNNTFAGRNVGAANTTGSFNSFLGESAGASNNVGFDNTFIGAFAGADNAIGINNTFVGSAAGKHTTGSNNTFVGQIAGLVNVTGQENAFFGHNTGISSTGSSNTFLGTFSGDSNTTGSSNTFVGASAGSANSIGVFNTIIGKEADVASNNLSFATAIGARSVVSNSNSIVLGRSDGSDTVRIPGAAIIDDTLIVHTLGGTGITQLCLNLADRLATCSSSLRYKSNIKSFFSGLDVVTRLRPIRFSWKQGDIQDIGFGAEEVNEIEPLLTTRNKRGEIEGVKYGQLTTVLVNAVKEQQAQIEGQQKQLQRQQLLIDSLKTLACQANPHAEICLQGERK